MRRSKRHYDEWADRLAAGNRDTHDEDAVSVFVGLLQVAPADEAADSHVSPVDLAGEALQVAQNAQARTSRGRDQQPLTMRWRRRAMISTFLSTLFGKIALGTAAVAVAATGAAATGNLPDAAQQQASDAFGSVGIEIPAPDRVPGVVPSGGGENPEASLETTAPVLPEEASDKAKAVTDTVFEGDPSMGREFGEAVGGTASDGAADIPERSTLPERSAAPEQPVIPSTPEAPELPAEADGGPERRP